MKLLLNIIVTCNIFCAWASAPEQGDDASVHPLDIIFGDARLAQATSAEEIDTVFTSLAGIPTGGLYKIYDYEPDQAQAEGGLNQLELPARLPALPLIAAPPSTRSSDVDSPRVIEPSDDESEDLQVEMPSDHTDKAGGIPVPELSPLLSARGLPRLILRPRQVISIVHSFDELQPLIRELVRGKSRSDVATIFDLDDVVVLHERGFLRGTFTRSRSFSDPDDAGVMLFYLMQHCFSNVLFKQFIAKVLEFELRKGDTEKQWRDATDDKDFFARNYGLSFDELIQKVIYNETYANKYGSYRLLMLIKQCLIGHGKLKYKVIGERTCRIMAGIRRDTRLMALTKTCTGYIEGSLSRGQLQTFFHVKARQISDQGISFKDILQDGALVSPILDSERAHNTSSVFVLTDTPRTPRPRILSAGRDSRSSVRRARSSSHSKTPVGADSPVIHDGIAFTSTMRKGAMLKVINSQFFRGQIKSVIFIDDSQRNLVDVGLVCHELGIAYHPVLFAIPPEVVSDAKLDVSVLQTALSYLSAMLILGEDGARPSEIVRYKLIKSARRTTNGTVMRRLKITHPDGTVERQRVQVTDFVELQDGKFYQRQVLVGARVIDEDTIMVGGEPIEGAQIAEDGTITRDGAPIEGAALIKAGTVMQGDQVIPGACVECDEDITLKIGNFVWSGYSDAEALIARSQEIIDAPVAEIGTILARTQSDAAE